LHVIISLIVYFPIFSIVHHTNAPFHEIHAVTNPRPAKPTLPRVLPLLRISARHSGLFYPASSLKRDGIVLVCAEKQLRVKHSGRGAV
jgi:hypothetical protein